VLVLAVHVQCPTITLGNTGTRYTSVTASYENVKRHALVFNFIVRISSIACTLRYIVRLAECTKAQPSAQL
jgi:hypothetical protein